MFEVYTNIKKANKNWGIFKNNNFISIDFLKIYYNFHPKIKHLFIVGESFRLYAQLISVKFNKTNKYLKTKSYISIFLKYISFDVLYLNNSFVTNMPSFSCKKKINLNKLLEKIKSKYSIVVIPDFLFENLNDRNINFQKIEVEEEMTLKIRKNWKSLEDYIFDLRKKYRYKVKNIIHSTNNLNIRNFSEKDIEKYSFNLQNLYTQVTNASKFNGAEFNTKSFALFIKKEYMNIKGYFIKDKLVGFSSEILQNKKLYSYFVGFDKKLNQTYPIYGRILIHNIKTAISLRVDHLILGRTANEYKSNFGAQPLKSFVYLKIKNPFLRTILKPIYTKVKIKKWKKRNALKPVNY